MTQLLPHRLIALHEAAAILEHALFAGEAESKIVQQLRADGLDLREREARAVSVTELWKAVDQQRVDALVICGASTQPLDLRPGQTKAVPFLRDPSVGSFTYLRPRHSLFRELTDWAGQDLSRVSAGVQDRAGVETCQAVGQNVAIENCTRDNAARQTAAIASTRYRSQRAYRDQSVVADPINEAAHAARKQETSFCRRSE